MTEHEYARLCELERLYKETEDATPFDAPQEDQDHLRDVHIALLRAQEVYLGLTGHVKMWCTIMHYYEVPYKPVCTREAGTITYWTGRWGYISGTVRFSRLLGGITPVVGTAIEYTYNVTLGCAERIVVVGDVASEAAYAEVMRPTSPVAGATQRHTRKEKQDSPRIDFGRFTDLT